ncbi:MAG: FHA domain-containing protein [Gammaproteobacteria bacterium]|nr:FHA domain-containing protein [Gammaproteobacteria bacterium]
MKLRFLTPLLLLPSLAHASAVELLAQRSGDTAREAQAVALAPDVVITRSVVLRRADSFIVIDPTTEARIHAEVIAENEALGLSLIKVPGASFDVTAVSARDFIAGEEISILTVADSRDGRVLSIDGVNITHDVAFDESEYGAMMLNRCGEVAAFNVDVKGGFLNSSYVGAEAPVEGVMISAAGDWLATNGINISTTVCLTAEQEAQAAVDAHQDALDAIQQELEQRQADLEAQQEAIEAAEAELEAARQESEQRQTDAEAARDELQQTQAELEAAEQEAQAQLEQQQAEIEAAEAERERANAEREAAIEEARVAAEHKQRTLIFSAIGGVIALLVILGVVISLRKRKQQLAQAKARFNDVVFSGHDGGGNPFRLRVDGGALLHAENGLVIGKNSQQANLVLSHPQVSRQHARIWVENGSLFIADLGSSNGTQVNDIPLASGSATALKNGDSVHFGGVFMKLEILA